MKCCWMLFKNITKFSIPFFYSSWSVAFLHHDWQLSSVITIISLLFHSNYLSRHTRDENIEHQEQEEQNRGRHKRTGVINSLVFSAPFKLEHFYVVMNEFNMNSLRERKTKWNFWVVINGRLSWWFHYT